MLPDDNDLTMQLLRHRGMWLVLLMCVVLLVIPLFHSRSYRRMVEESGSGAAVEPGEGADPCVADGRERGGQVDGKGTEPETLSWGLALPGAWGDVIVQRVSPSAVGRYEWRLLLRTQYVYDQWVDCPESFANDSQLRFGWLAGEPGQASYLVISGVDGHRWALDMTLAIPARRWPVKQEPTELGIAGSE